MIVILGLLDHTNLCMNLNLIKSYIDLSKFIEDLNVIFIFGICVLGAYNLWSIFMGYTFRLSLIVLGGSRYSIFG